MNKEILIEKLNDNNVNVRLESIKAVSRMIETGLIKKTAPLNYVNNHIHTFYSFSPYSPAKAIWTAYNSGLQTAGIMDHDSVSGAEEFIEAGKIIGMATTTGVECRVDFSNTEFKNMRINNPDQDSNAYIAIHGIPHTQIKKVKEFFIPLIKKRNERNRKMVCNLNNIIKKYSIEIDFDEDVVPISQFKNGGSVTERHIFYAFSLKLIGLFDKGKRLVDFIRNELSINIPSKIENFLLDAENPFYDYDLLGLLKSEMVEKFYIPAAAECLPVEKIVDFANSIQAIPAYAYLGDIEDSVTGDKKAQKFEDNYIEKLFAFLKKIDFKAVTYMPSRNSIDQLTKIKDLCRQYDFFEISGEDINSPRQSFICEALNDPLFNNLFDSTWALIGHEKQATEDLTKAMFSKETIKKFPELQERINVYKDYGKIFDYHELEL